MATVQTLLNRAGRLLGVLASNTTMGTDESADALVALNAMLDAWRNEELMCYARQSESLTLSASTASYTIGPGGTLNTTRPVAVEQCWIEASNITYQVKLIEDGEYNNIPDKASTAQFPNRANYRPTMSTGILYVYPVPNATATMKLFTRIVVAAFSAVTDTVTLPPGWEDALASNLAVRLAPEYEGSKVSDELRMMARESRAGIKRINMRPLKAHTELPALLGGGRSNIITNSP